MSKYRILALDGGGIRGVLTATILERLEAECPGFLSKINLFAGTSTGGILALGLASGLTPADIRGLYEASASQVFMTRPLRFLIEKFDQFLEKFDQFYEADYRHQPLAQALSNQFGSKTLGELEKHVLITSFDLDDGGVHDYPRRWQPKIFNNFGEDPDCAQRVVDVALYTSAAPSYFPIYQGFVDGGVIANNPSMCALAQAIRKGAKGGNQVTKNIRLLSLGTGINPTHLEVQEDKGNWGYVQWLIGEELEAAEIKAIERITGQTITRKAMFGALVKLMLEGNVALADYQCKQILRNKYRRFDPLLKSAIDLDAVDKIKDLKDFPCIVEDDLYNKKEWDDTVQWVKKSFLAD